MSRLSRSIGIHNLKEIDLSESDSEDSSEDEVVQAIEKDEIENHSDFVVPDSQEESSEEEFVPGTQSESEDSVTGTESGDSESESAD